MVHCGSGSAGGGGGVLVAVHDAGGTVLSVVVDSGCWEEDWGLLLLLRSKTYWATKNLLVHI